MPRRSATYPSPRGEEIRAYRELLDLSQSQFAHLVCIAHRQTVGDWERDLDSMPPGLWKLARLAGARILKRRRQRARALAARALP